MADYGSGTIKIGGIQVDNELTISGIPIPATQINPVVDTRIFSNAASVDLIDNSGVIADAYEIHLFNVTTTSGAGAVVSMLMSTNQGVSFDTTAKYTSGGGLSEWSNGTGGAEGILHVRNTYPHSGGCTIAIDALDQAGYGSNGVVRIQSPGVINGVNMATSYQAHTMTLPFASNGYNIMLLVSGYYDGALGSRVNAFRIQSDRYGATGSLISGKMVLKRVL